MKRFIITLLMIPSLLVSQEEINRNLGEFTKLSIYDGINVELIKSDENKVEASGENTRFVVVKNKNGNLKIRLNVQKRFSGDRTMVKLYYKNIYSFIAHEGSNIFSKDTIKQADLKIVLIDRIANIDETSRNSIQKPLNAIFELGFVLNRLVILFA